ncbi:MAG: hypothetical protein UX47_C0006G0040 [Candidatus Collierbacteria bacterium GW2011_GWA2_46_26]|uniref:Uncharacterized protein n=1 Tax=Candidatus Collierbacteria bacterium GW2011_GWA2_46_26 TaxID=1618381 RepID=A0A0G1PJS2_9BACT|nr:MAG: hypothetical protein UX47_C0006G0040 [Candidatus Collierbacteria bacterium GW2011_GWA2_46_26]
MRKNFDSRSFVLVCALFVFVLAVVLAVAMFTRAGWLTKEKFSVPGEPDNAYMVHMFEQSSYREQFMCNSYGACVLYRTPPMGMMYQVTSVEIDDEVYYETARGNEQYVVTARGIYCAGGIDTHSCLELVVLFPQPTCPSEVVYFRFTALLVPDSCLQK